MAGKGHFSPSCDDSTFERGLFFGVGLDSFFERLGQ
jgi:hypothetical protein